MNSFSIQNNSKQSLVYTTGCWYFKQIKNFRLREIRDEHHYSKYITHPKDCIERLGNEKYLSWV